MNSKYLKKWAIEQNVWQRTINGFWHSFENYKIEEPNEYEEYFQDFNNDLLTLDKSQIALRINSWDYLEEEYNENMEYVEVFLDIIYKDEKMGYYSLLFNFYGETFNEYFVIE